MRSRKPSAGLEKGRASQESKRQQMDEAMGDKPTGDKPACGRCGWHAERAGVRLVRELDDGPGGSPRYVCNECLIAECGLRFRKQGWLTTPLMAWAAALHVGVDKRWLSPTATAVVEARALVQEFVGEFHRQAWCEGLREAFFACGRDETHALCGATSMHLTLVEGIVAICLRQQDEQEVSFCLSDKRSRSLFFLYTVEGYQHAARAMIYEAIVEWKCGRIQLV